MLSEHATSKTTLHDVYTQDVHEDIEEGIHRMMDEGGGVVDQNFPAGAPILRNDLVASSEDA
ncbi:hypothetical protein [Ferroacidibacillus organovorans]|uniref:Uncharacterized protein n=1 Tax=Ferroacidibacillus organovorans TaxID=1765683 RepID=A0A853K845_9BACL|nr:hypothetical protein [Ferroacidibacillus organovorans]KYP80092.1 hypothetical protein AYJ22_12395 [Ferroacidibacillus organovorans]OAG93123.1 hypothetical protein AYW79_12265 [Ferroacidibacillus organovorans]